MKLSDLYSPGKSIGESATLSSFLGPILQNISIVIAVLSFFSIILAGVRYVSNAGNEKEISNASNTLTFAFIGLILSIAAFWVTKILFAVGGFGGIF